MITSYQLLGHRGARAEALENTRAGFERAQRLQKKQLSGVEFDIQMTADKRFVVVHDETLMRLANAQSWIADKPLAELTGVLQSDFSRYQAAVHPAFIRQPILPLEDLLPLLTGFCHIELEIKTHAKSAPQLLVKHLLRLLSDSHWRNLPITLTSFDTDILYQLQNQQSILTPIHRYPSGLLLEPSTSLASQIAFLPNLTPQGQALLQATLNYACELGCRQIGVYHPLITEALMIAARRVGLKVTAWTVNDIQSARRLIALGVDCIITDVPSQFLEQL